MQNGSHVFLPDWEVPAELRDHDIRMLDHDQQLELMDRAVDRAEGWVRGMMEISRAVVLADRDGADVGLRELAVTAEQYSDDPFVLFSLSYIREELEAAVTSGSSRS